MLSIIIIVKNDPQVSSTLNALNAIEYPEDHEILVVSGSAERKLISALPQVRYIPFTGKTEKKITIPEQRNTGIRAARGSIIIFVDASCIPAKDWITRLLAPIYREKESIVAGRAVSTQENSFRSQTRSPATRYLSEAPTINLAVRREVFETIGLFDESFEYGSDVDISWRAIDAGYRIRSQPSAIVSHDWGNVRAEFKRAFRYGKARARLYKKHKRRIRTIPGSDPVTLLYPLLLCILPLAVFIPPILLFYLVPIVKNRSHKPLFTTAYNTVYGFGVLMEVFKIPVSI